MALILVLASTVTCFSCSLRILLLFYSLLNIDFFLLQVQAKQLEHAKKELDGDLVLLKAELDQQRERRLEQDRRVGANTRYDRPL